MIRAGDTVTLVDTCDQTSHYILSTSYAHDSLRNTLTLDNPPNRMDRVHLRLGLAISAISWVGHPRSAALPWVDHPDCLGLPVGSIWRAIDIDVGAIAHAERGPRNVSAVFTV